MNRAMIYGMNTGQKPLHDTSKRELMPRPRFRRILPVPGLTGSLPALLTAVLILTACDTLIPVPSLAFRTPTVFKSKLLYETQGKVQSYTNELLVNGEPVDDDLITEVTYTITEPADYAAKNIRLNENTGELRFENIPATVTVQAAHARGGTATYTFTVADHFSKRNNHSSVVLGADIYVMGGSGETGSRSNDVWKSSDGGATWIPVTTATSARFSARRDHSSVVLNNAIYVIGGFDPTTSSISNRRNDVWKSTDGGKNWAQVPTTGTTFPPRSNHSSVVLGSDIYVIGGYNGFRSVNDIWKSGDGGATWQQVVTTGAKFSVRSTHSSVVLGSDIYVIGGLNQFTNSIDDQVWKSSDGGATWTQIATTGAKFSARYVHSSVTVGSAIYVIGGGGAGAALFDEVWKSTNGGVSWTQIAKATARFSPRHNHGSVVLNDTIYVIGGYSNDFTNDVWKSEDGGAAWENVHAAP